MSNTVKLTTIGNSVGIVLPKEILAKLNVEKGDTLYVSEIPDGIQLTPYDQDFADQMKAARRVMKENRDVLRRLAELWTSLVWSPKEQSLRCTANSSQSMVALTAFVTKRYSIPPSQSRLMSLHTQMNRIFSDSLPPTPSESHAIKHLSTAINVRHSWFH